MEECEEQKEAYRNKLSEYYAKALGQELRNGITVASLQQMFTYVIKGITAENLALDTIQPEIMYGQICDYFDMMEGICR